MKEVICYTLSDGSIYYDKQKAIEAEYLLNNKQVIDNSQKTPLKFKVGDIVYVASRNLVRQCIVTCIEDQLYTYDETSNEKRTEVYLEDLNDKTQHELYFITTAYDLDLNDIIKLTPQELYNFKYEL